MKRMSLFIVFVLVFCLNIFAEEGQMAAGLGPEWNMNSRENFAGGIVLGFNYNLPIDIAQLTVGVNATISTNFSGYNVLEPAILIRWYFLGKDYMGFFAQADLGVFLIIEDGDTDSLFLGGLRGGFRMPLGSSLFIEPYGRIGYPFAFGVGAIAGIRF